MLRMNEEEPVVPLVDAHCHVLTNPSKVEPEHELSNHRISRALMSNNPYDWNRLQSTQFEGNDRNLPQYKGFGIHPWYSHLFTLDHNKTLTKDEHYRQVLIFKQTDDTILSNLIRNVLPDPVYIEDYISKIDFNKVDLIGEIGLDKSFSVPSNGFYQGHDSNNIITNTRIKVSMDHQLKIFNRMLQLACVHSLNVSLHDVNCHMKLLDTCQQHLLKNPAINICLHSYTGSIDFLLTQWIKTFTEDRIFLSVSQYINFKKIEGNIDYSQVPQKCILTETDYIVDSNNITDIFLQDSLKNTLENLTNVIPLASSQDTRKLVYENFCRFMHT